MSRHARTCVVIPTYNERENIGILIDGVNAVFSSNAIQGSIVVVDDNSPDGTGLVVEEMAKVRGNIHVIHRPGKLGLGSAYRDGFRYALDALKPHVILQMDADMSHDPKHIPAFLSRVEEGFDLVVGSRRVPGGKAVGWGPSRRLMSWGGSFLARLLCGIRVKDPTSGYRALTARAVELLLKENIRSEGYAFQVEILYLAQRLGLSICEVPIVFVDRARGRSKLKGSDVLAFALRCIALGLNRVLSSLGSRAKPERGKGPP